VGRQFRDAAANALEAEIALKIRARLIFFLAANA
jgi:hypothetical protein